MSSSIRRLGVDPGAKRIGLALADPDVSIAFPYQTLEANGPESAARAIAERIAAEGVEEVVIGLPLQMDGTEGESARRARLLAARLGALTSVPLILWDERLSTVTAARALTHMGVSAKKSRKKLDQSAAALILQSYLDSKRDAQWTDLQDPPDAWPTGRGEKNSRRTRREKKPDR